LVGEQDEWSESGSFSDPHPDRRDPGAQASENREMAERGEVTLKPGCHQAKLDREIGRRESGGPGRHISSRILPNAETFEGAAASGGLEGTMLLQSLGG
jgi:hypothetical protein